MPSADSAPRVLEVDSLTVDFVTTDRVVHAVRDLVWLVVRRASVW